MSKVKKLFGNDLIGVALPVAVLFVILLIGSPGFISEYNIISVLQSVAIFVLIGLAQMSALSLGQFNLAVGAMGCLSAISMGLLMQVFGVNPAAAIIIGVAVGVGLGAFQGLLIAKTGLSPFIITLALISVYTGIATVITKGESYNKLPAIIQQVSRAQIGPIPVTFLIALALCAGAYILFRYTNVGKRLQATGANMQAARYSGINVDGTVILGHSLSGLFCGLAAFIQICKFNSAQLAIGDDWMMTSFVVAVLGGTLLSGGKVSVVGTVLGSFLMVFINNALGLWHVNTYAFQAIMGVVLLLAYELDRARVAFVKRQTVVEAKKEDVK